VMTVEMVRETPRPIVEAHRMRPRHDRGDDWWNGRLLPMRGTR
jgi:hypothetical protein